MDPRLSSSTKWTPFPEELCEQTEEVLNQRFKQEYGLENSFVVEGRIYSEEILGRYGLRVKDQLKQPNFEISFEFDPKEEKALEWIQKSMDIVEFLWTELLEEDLDDKKFSRYWQPMALGKKTCFYKFSTVNTELEKEAEKWLAKYEKKLVYGED